jgi:hypothetical protein
MEPVTMTIANQNISCITDVDTVRVVGDVLTSNTTLKVTLLIEHNHTVALQS